jgi:hypothetical protein
MGLERLHVTVSEVYYLSMKLPFYLPITILLLLSTVFGAGDVKKLVFEDQLIEGKIRRPQLVLIKARSASGLQLHGTAEQGQSC